MIVKSINHKGHKVTQRERRRKEGGRALTMTSKEKGQWGIRWASDSGSLNAQANDERMLPSLA